jgi:hypothetical protein
MNRNQTKDQDRSEGGQRPQNHPRERQRDDNATSKPDDRDEMRDPVGTPETNQPIDDAKGRSSGQNLEPGRNPREDEPDPKEPAYDSDVLKPGR